MTPLPLVVTPPSRAATLEVGGFVPFTTVDYPGKLSAVVFCQGCPWRCGYCHNRHLQPFQRGSIAWLDILARLEKRVGFLDAVVFSGGEPTAQIALSEAIEEVRALGFLIGLHTAGIYPARLATILPRLDWVGFDFKAPVDERYDQLTGVPGSADAVAESLAMLLKANVPHQIRTTRDPERLNDLACSDLARHLHQSGAAATHWQTCRKATI